MLLMLMADEQTPEGSANLAEVSALQIGAVCGYSFLSASHGLLR